MYRRSQGGKFYLAVEDRHPLAEEFSRLRAQYLNPERLLPFIENHLDLSDVFTFCQAPVVILELLSPDGIFNTGLPGRRLIHPDAGKFGIGVCTPWKIGIIDFSWNMENGIADDNPPFISRGMSKLVCPRNVPGGINMLLSRSKPCINCQALTIVCHTDIFEAEPFQIRFAPRRHHQHLSPELNRLSVFLLHGNFFSPIDLSNGFNGCIQMEGHPL